MKVESTERKVALSPADVGSLNGELGETTVIKKNSLMDQLESIKTEIASIKTEIENAKGNSAVISQVMDSLDSPEKNIPDESQGFQLQNIPKIDRGFFYIECVHCPCSYHLHCAKEYSPDLEEASLDNWCCPKCR